MGENSTDILKLCGSSLFYLKEDLMISLTRDEILLLTIHKNRKTLVNQLQLLIFLKMGNPLKSKYIACKIQRSDTIFRIRFEKIEKISKIRNRYPTGIDPSIRNPSACVT